MFGVLNNNNSIVLRIYRKAILHLSVLITKLVTAVTSTDTIVVNGFLEYSFGRLKNNNFGDDINIPLLQTLTNQHVTYLENYFCKKNRENLLAIGSLIENFTTPYSLIWGSGCISFDMPIKIKPKKVYAVRGPLTRERLLKEGIACPEVYGDPALLFPHIYSPKLDKHYEIGIIAHYVDYDLPHVREFREKHPDIKFIKLRNYESWQSVIDEINSCKVILSSSLHGLIISDAYKIPNVWIKLSNNITGGDFKYKDYFGGVGRDYISPLDFSVEINIQKGKDAVNSYKKINYNPRSLLDAFPYPPYKEGLQL